MKLPDVLIEDLIKELAGADAVELVRTLVYKENVSEFQLAEDLSLNVNQVRNILYRLTAHNLVHSIRKKDRQKGWYIYYWTFDFKHAKSLLIYLKKKKIEELKKELEKAKSEVGYFICSEKCVKMDMNEAMENQFRCPECGKIMEQKSNDIRIKQLENSIKKLEADLRIRWDEYPVVEEVKEGIKEKRIRKSKKKISKKKKFKEKKLSVKKRVIKKKPKRKVKKSIKKKVKRKRK